MKQHKECVIIGSTVNTNNNVNGHTSRYASCVYLPNNKRTFLIKKFHVPIYRYSTFQFMQDPQILCKSALYIY